MTIWPVLHYDDTRTALRFLVDAFGFEVATAVDNEHGEPGHVELRWPGGGALVFGSTSHTDSVHGKTQAGTNAVYVVTDDPDAVHTRALTAGATIVNAPANARFGNGADARASTARDPEGNLWTFGTYRGA